MSAENTQTPRTDAASFLYCHGDVTEVVVEADFARTLERESAALREKSERLAALHLDALDEQARQAKLMDEQRHSITSLRERVASLEDVIKEHEQIFTTRSTDGRLVRETVVTGEDIEKCNARIAELEGRLAEANVRYECLQEHELDTVKENVALRTQLSAAKLAAKALERIEKNLSIMAPNGDARAIAKAALTALREAGVKTEEGTT